MEECVADFVPGFVNYGLEGIGKGEDVRDKFIFIRELKFSGYFFEVFFVFLCIR